MIPVVTPAEMAEIDRDAPEPVDVLVARAGWAVAAAAVDMLGGTYGRRVVVVAGKGNNGADGRCAAAVLARRGVRVQVVDAAGGPGLLPDGLDLVIDAAYGTGFRGEYQAPEPGDVPVLAVDIPSGVDGLTGAAGPGAVHADRTVTFAGLKPGLLFPPGRELAGRVDVVDIGLDVGRATIHVVEHGDVDGWVPWRPVDTHKWKSAVWVVAGSPGMTGAAHLCARAAMRAGAGTVRLGIPGVPPDPPYLEVVGRSIPAEGWADDVLADLGRTKALVVGPGLGRSDAGGAEVCRLVASAPVPTIVDADGLYALGTAEEAAAVIGPRSAPTVLTPHDGEYKRLAGHPPGDDRIAAARDLAARTHAAVLLKGPTTVVGDPSGEVLLSTAGDERLATAGTGDVLAGVVGAYLAQGLDGLHAAAAAAFVHGSAGHLGWRHGLVAGDLLDLLPAVLDRR
ncbi:MAG: ADP-dependent NAD(P)H-hydrate dehydratase / NAD(P)H-hydrate epimerase [Actinomycetota bacterium]|nr:ADP-dependent NAD(P)H-hydrate dehydratase / NAD(P)H-hydrate epimerase [Actinomycetota bacterium]